MRRQLNFHSMVLKCENISQLFVPLWKPIFRIRSLLQLMPGNTPVSEPASQSGGSRCWQRCSESAHIKSTDSDLNVGVYIKSRPNENLEFLFQSCPCVWMVSTDCLLPVSTPQLCWSHLCLQLVSHFLHSLWGLVQRQQLAEVVLQHTLDLRTHTFKRSYTQSPEEHSDLLVLPAASQ